MGKYHKKLENTIVKYHIGKVHLAVISNNTLQKWFSTLVVQLTQDVKSMFQDVSQFETNLYLKQH